MSASAKNQPHHLVARWVKTPYRAIRVRILSLGLPAGGSFQLSKEEQSASKKISVIVAVHDSPEVTLRCLNSLEKFGGDAEVIVVDDGSKLEATRRMLEAFCSRLHWKLVRHESALGHSRASEAGVKASRRPYFCLLNSDTVLTPHSWLGMVRAFETSPQIAVAGPSTSQTPTPQRVMRACHCRRYWTDDQICAFAVKYVARHGHEPIVDLPFAGGFAFFMRRTAWDESGGFDKNLPDYGNEAELCRRLKQSGLRVVWAKSSYIHHLGSETYGRTFGVNVINERCLEADSYIQRKWVQ